MAQNSINLDNLDYTTLTHLRSAFQRSGGRSQIYDGNSLHFNATDTPGWNYFKILFDFESPFLNLACNEKDQLRPQNLNLDKDNFITINNKKIGHRDVNGSLIRATNAGEFDPNTEIVNTAYNYLLLNCEFERAELLRQFVQLLTNINTMSPWYFQEIGGLAEAVNRPELLSSEYKPVGDEYKTFTIKCLPDAMDARIGTLLDLYKSICFSQTLHKAILPANLRKFDMTIYIFNTKIGFSRKVFNWSSLKFEDMSKGLHVDASFEQHNSSGQSNSLAEMNTNSNTYVTSSKMFTFHNCEFDPNSNISAYSTLNNSEGWGHEYTIRILFDNAFEQRYNEHIQRYIGDMIAWDIDYKLTGETEEPKYAADNMDNMTSNLKAALKERLNLDTQSNLQTKLGNAATDIVESVAAYAMGNIFYTDWLASGNALQNIESRLINRGEQWLTGEARELAIKGSHGAISGIKSLFNSDKQSRREKREERKANRKLQNLRGNAGVDANNGLNNLSNIGRTYSSGSVGDSQLGTNLNTSNSNNDNTDSTQLGANLRDL